MMEVMFIPFQEELLGLNAQSASSQFKPEKQSYWIDHVNWPNVFSYCPYARIIIAHSGVDLYIKFQIIETNIRAFYDKDQDPVWEDSCVEFFCQKQGSDTYMNFEFNCIGACVATTRKGRSNDVVPFSEDQMKQIDRFQSLNEHTFTEKEGLSFWELTVKIPFKILDLDSNGLSDGLMGNFYKCADGSSTPHYVSWSPIMTEAPDFHCPAFFGKLVFGN